MKFIRKTVKFFDKMEDSVRDHLSHHPILYGFVGGVGVVLFWRGVWHTADVLEMTTIWGAYLLSPINSLIVGSILLLISGLFVSVLIGESVIIHTLKDEKPITKKTEKDLQKEVDEVTQIKETLARIEEKLSRL